MQYIPDHVERLCFGGWGTWNLEEARVNFNRWSFVFREFLYVLQGILGDGQKDCLRSRET